MTLRAKVLNLCPRILAKILVKILAKILAKKMAETVSRYDWEEAA